jgi:thioredoxin-like negative regulator of GroEL
MFISVLANAQVSETSYVINNDYETAKVLAKETDMPILLIFSADWCGYCQQLKKDLPSIKDMDRYIVCIIDIEANPDFKVKMGVKSLPTSIIINQINNNEISRKIGYKISDYSRWLQRKSN